MPWSTVQGWQRREYRPITELICAENSASYLNYDILPIRQ
jgi:hypothetical protein